jgi:type II secretory pathway pseudopilin PulG
MNPRLTSRAASEKRSDESGLTLLELMMASGIMALALAFLFGSLIAISLASGLTENRASAVTHLSSVLEEVRGLSYNELLAYEPPDFHNLAPTEAITVECYKDDGTPLQLPVNPDTLTNPLPNPLQVRCTVAWNDPRGHALQMRASQLVYR